MSSTVSRRIFATGDRHGGARPVVAAVRDGQSVCVFEPPGLAVLDVLRTVKHVLGSHGTRGQKIVRTPEPLPRLARRVVQPVLLRGPGDRGFSAVDRRGLRGPTPDRDQPRADTLAAPRPRGGPQARPGRRGGAGLRLRQRARSDRLRARRRFGPADALVRGRLVINPVRDRSRHDAGALPGALFVTVTPGHGHGRPGRPRGPVPAPHPSPEQTPSVVQRPDQGVTRVSRIEPTAHGVVGKFAPAMSEDATRGARSPAAGFGATRRPRADK